MPEFQNAQWILDGEVLDSRQGAVTPNMRGETPPYEIERKRLFEKTEGAGTAYYDWPVHMANKAWVDIELFLEAFEAAIKSETARSGIAIDEQMLAKSFQYARVDNARMRSHD